MPAAAGFSSANCLQVLKKIGRYAFETAKRMASFLKKINRNDIIIAVYLSVLNVVNAHKGRFR